jgi:hypothetical protein
MAETLAVRVTRTSHINKLNTENEQLAAHVETALEPAWSVKMSDKPDTPAKPPAR